jgi:hypothetical protein
MAHVWEIIVTHMSGALQSEPFSDGALRDLFVDVLNPTHGVLFLALSRDPLE